MIQNVHKTTISPADLILQYNLKVKGVIQSWNTTKPGCDTTTHKTIPNPEGLIWQYSSQGRHDTNSQYNDAVLKYILKRLTWTLSIRRSQYVVAATIHDFVCMDPSNQQHRFSSPPPISYMILLPETNTVKPEKIQFSQKGVKS